MMYFIHYSITDAFANKRSRELNKFISQFQNALISSESSLYFLRYEVRNLVAALNKKYPKVQELIFNETNTQWSVKPIGETDGCAFIFTIFKVQRQYKYLEQRGILCKTRAVEQKGGDQ